MPEAWIEETSTNHRNILNPYREPKILYEAFRGFEVWRREVQLWDNIFSSGVSTVASIFIYVGSKIVSPRKFRHPRRPVMNAKSASCTSQYYQG